MPAIPHVRGNLLERKPTLLQHQVGLVTFSNEFDLDHGFIVVPRRHGDQQPPRYLAHVTLPGPSSR